MPIYEFECDGCDANVRFDKEFKIDEPHELECPVCQNSMRKVYQATPTIFKAKGFYSTGG
jgi:putative FmdB family regulatory protein